jgi:cbb3-type cytochrome oxidase maturation protein
MAAGAPAAGAERGLMDILYLLIPLSVILVFFILGGLWWAINRGQFEDIEGEAERILKDP